MACLEALRDGGAALACATRVDDATAAAIQDRWPGAVIDAEARCAFVGELPEPVGNVLVLTAGTSDGRVAAEVAATLAAGGVGCRRVDDVGVAGVHRVLAVAPELSEVARAPAAGRPEAAFVPLDALMPRPGGTPAPGHAASVSGVGP